MRRSNPYEQAFAAWARRWGAVVLPLQELQRHHLAQQRVKTPDFLVLGRGGPQDARLVVDVKGRLCKASRPGGQVVWPNWCFWDDVQTLPRWAESFGPRFRPVLAFVYRLAPSLELPPTTPDLFSFRGQRYLIRGVDVRDYRDFMRPRSPSWQTVYLTVADFRRLVQPFSSFLPDLQSRWDQTERPPRDETTPAWFSQPKNGMAASFAGTT